MTDDTKTPQAGEWWVNSKGSIAYIAGVKLSGTVVYEDVRGWSYASDDMDWSDWHHEPRCTGFDWVEPAAIYPGEEYRLLQTGEMIVADDGYFDPHSKRWHKVISAGATVGEQFTRGSYRRKIMPAPQTMRQPVRLFVIRDLVNEQHATGVHASTMQLQGEGWVEIQHDENGWYVEGVQ